jgi:hypothetical protein
MTRAAILLLSVVALLVGCERRPLPVVEVGGNTAQLAVTDEALVDAIDSFSALLFQNQQGQKPCPDLLAMSVAELQAAEPVVNLSLAKDDVDAGVIFGSIRTGGLHSFLILGAAGGGDTPITLENADGKIIAVGCEELEVVQDQRRSIQVTLFPAGLR